MLAHCHVAEQRTLLARACRAGILYVVLVVVCRADAATPYHTVVDAACLACVHVGGLSVGHTAHHYARTVATVAVDAAVHHHTAPFHVETSCLRGRGVVGEQTAGDAGLVLEVVVAAQVFAVLQGDGSSLVSIVVGQV